MAYKPKKVLKDTFASVLTSGLEAIEEEALPIASEELEKIELPPDMPEFYKEQFKKAAGGGKFIQAAALAPYALAAVMGIALGTMTPFAQWASMPLAKLLNTYRLDPGTVSQLWLRGFPKGQDAEEWKNLSSEEKAAKTAELKGDVEKWFGELSDQGFGGDEQEAVKELARYLPAPTEIMTWAAREVFEPKLREKYQLDKFLPPEFLEWAAKVGITGEVAKNYWASHWVLPSLTAIQELWRRKILKKEDVDAFWTELDMVPWVREDLFKLFRAVPTRVDVRRFWDMRTIDEPRLRDIYQAQGYWEEDLEDYVMWTKVYVDFPDLMARYKNGWINLEDVKTQLVTVDGMKEERFEELLQTKIKTVQEERIAETTALTRSLIIKGAKADPPKLDRAETIELLMLKNYDKWEAEYIYDIEVTGAASPETPMEFRQMVESYRHAVGLEFKEVPPELLEADRKRSELRLKLSQAISKEAPEVAQLQADLEIAEVAFQNMKTGYGL